MTDVNIEELIGKLSNFFQPHPWHGVALREKGQNEYVNAFIEIVPSDKIKYELDKASGFLKIDRPQKFTNVMPAMYGLVPKTYCAEKCAEYTSKILDRKLEGDHDPLDILVLSEREVTHGNLLVECRPIGGLRMIDGGEVDDKIIAVLKDDAVYGDFKDVSELPSKVAKRLSHFFLTYKGAPEEGVKPKVEITHVYNAEEAKKVIELATEDYNSHFPMSKLLNS